VWVRSSFPCLSLGTATFSWTYPKRNYKILFWTPSFPKYFCFWDPTSSFITADTYLSYGLNHKPFVNVRHTLNLSLPSTLPHYQIWNLWKIRVTEPHYFSAEAIPETVCPVTSEFWTLLPPVFRRPTQVVSEAARGEDSLLSYSPTREA